MRGCAERVAALHRGVVWRACPPDARTEIPGGWVTRLPDAPLVHQVNTVRLRTWPDHGDLDALADRHQPGLRFRRVVIEDDDPRLPAGWQRERVILMALDGGDSGRAPRPLDARAREVGEAELVAVERQVLDEDAAGVGDGRTLSAQISHANAAMRAGTICRRFIAEDAAMATLFLDPVSGVALVESVGTLRMWREQGCGDAVLSAAVAAARDDGATTIGIVTDAEDWPQLWYAARGFTPVARQVIHVRAVVTDSVGGRV